MDTETELQMNQILIDAYIHTKASVKAKETIENLLEDSTIRGHTHQSTTSMFVLDNRHALIDRNDNTVDNLLNDNSTDDSLLREATLIRAIQQLYYQNIDFAKSLFIRLCQSNTSDNIYQQSCIGLAFTEALQSGDYQFLRTMPNLPEHKSMPWYLWYLEYLLISGQWVTLTEHLVSNELLTDMD